MNLDSWESLSFLKEKRGGMLTEIDCVLAEIDIASGDVRENESGLFGEFQDVLRDVKTEVVEKEGNVTRVGKVSIDEVLQKICQSKKWLFKNGFNLFALCSIFTFAYLAKFESKEPNAKGFMASSAMESESPLGLYRQTIIDDNEKRVLDFLSAAVADYSGLGYSACTVDSDCLSGEQTCKPGTVPNTVPMPGYCVPSEFP